MKRRLASLTSALAAAAALTGNAAAEPHPQPAPEQPGISEFDGVQVNPPDGVTIDSVAVENSLGDVRIEGHDDRIIAIDAYKRAPDAETLKRLTVAFTPNPNGTVTITTALKPGDEARPVAAGSVRVDLVIRMPRGARPQVNVWNGQLTVHGLDNGAELSTNIGDIDVRHVSGAITAQSGHGSQQFAELVGANIDAQTIEGDLALEVVRGERLDATVHDGEVVGREMRFREMSIRTTHGDIWLDAELVPGGRYQVASYAGSVSLKLARRVPLRVRARSRKARVFVSPVLSPVASRNGMMMTGSFGNGRSAAEIMLQSHKGNVILATW